MSNSIFKHISASPFGRLWVGLFLLVLSLTANAANKKTTVAQVTEPVTVTDDVDYTITSETPFADGGTINIANTEHATVILNAVKPSAAIRLLANYVTIDGKKAD